MKSRIYYKFDELKKQHKTAFITFVTAGDPNIDTTYELVLSMEAAGADIIELGVPNSDPLADGPVIQDASFRALKAGTKMNDVFELVKKLRTKTEVPLVFLVYYNNVFNYGVDKFIKMSEESGLDGLIIPDIPIEERKEILEKLAATKVNLIPLVALTSEERIKHIVEGAEGFVYCVASLGVTGGHTEINSELTQLLEKVSEYTDLPKAVGFGISTKEDVIKLKGSCDGVIMGSAVVRKVKEGIDNGNIAEHVHDFVKDIKSVM